MIQRLFFALILLPFFQTFIKAESYTPIDQKRFNEIKHKSIKSYETFVEKKELHIENFKVEKRFTGFVAKSLLQLSDIEKEKLFVWIQKNRASIHKSHIDIIKMLLGDQQALELIIAKLREGIEDRKFYFALRWFDWKKIPALFKERHLLLPLLKKEKIHVTSILANFEKEFWRNYVTQLYLDPSFTNRTKLLHLVKDIDDIESLNLMSQMIKYCTTEKQLDDYYYYLSLYLKSTKEECRKLAFELLCQLAKTNLTLDSGFTLRQMYEYDHSKALPFIKAHLENHIKMVTPQKSLPLDYLLRILVYETGKDSLKKLNLLLKKPHFKKTVIQLILILNQDSQDHLLAEHMYKICLKAKLYDFALDIAGIGGHRAKELGFKLCLAKGENFDRQAAWWIENELTLLKATNIAFELGVINEKPSVEDVFKVNVFSEVFKPVTHRFYDYLSSKEHMLNFDLETGLYPVGYQSLLLDKITKLTKTDFQPQETYELYLEAEEKYLIAFTENNKSYSFKCENMGDWYDMNSVVKTINKYLMKKGNNRRLIMLESLGQNCLLLHLEQDKFDQLKSRLFLTPSGKYREVIESNKNFEKRILEKLDLKEH